MNIGTRKLLLLRQSVEVVSVDCEVAQGLAHFIELSIVLLLE